MQSRFQNFSWKSGSSILFPDPPFRLVSNKNTDVTGVVSRQCPVTIKLKGASVVEIECTWPLKARLFWSSGIQFKGKLMYIMILRTKEKKKVNNKSCKPPMFDVVPSQGKTVLCLPSFINLDSQAIAFTSFTLVLCPEVTDNWKPLNRVNRLFIRLYRCSVLSESGQHNWFTDSNWISLVFLELISI